MGVAFTLDDQFSGPSGKIQNSMNKLEGVTDKLEAKVSNSMRMMKTGMGMIAAGAAISAPFVMGIKHASDYEENVNKLNVAFGDYAGNVKAFTDKALANYGIDKVQASDMASLFGDMSTGMGLTQRAASDMSMTLVGLAGDLSSFKNIRQDMAQNALKGIYTGETEALKNLGIVMTSSNLEGFIERMSGVKQSFQDMSQQEKVMWRFKFVMDASKNSLGDFARTSEGYANSKRIMQGSLKELSASLGEVLMPLFAKGAQMVAKFAKGLEKFAQSPAGKVVLRLIAAFGALLVIGGVVMVVVSGIRLGVMKMAGMFRAATKAQILHAIATKGTVAGLKAMGRAAWASLGPWILLVGFIMLFVKAARWAWKSITEGSKKMMFFGSVVLMALGPIGWIIWLFAMLKRAVNEFNKLGEGQGASGGIIGFLQKVGGYVLAAKEIWKSWNGETFTISANLKKKLEALGIFDSVLAMGTWIVRLKTMFMGVWEGMKEGFKAVWDVVKSVMNSIYESFQPAEKQLDKLGLGFKKNTSDLEKWRKAGKYIGYALVAIILLVTISMVIMAIAMLVAMIIPMIILAIIIVLIWLIYKAWQWLKQAAVDAWNGITESLRNFWAVMVSWWDWFVSIPERVYQWGVDFVNSIWEGVKSAWEGFKQWLSDAWEGIKWLFGFGGADEVSAKVEKKVTGTVTGKVEDRKKEKEAKGEVKSDGTHHKNTSKNPKVILPANKDNTPGAGETFVFQNVMDGEVISEKVIQKNEFKQARG